MTVTSLTMAAALLPVSHQDFWLLSCFFKAPLGSDRLAGQRVDERGVEVE